MKDTKYLSLFALLLAFACGGQSMAEHHGQAGAGDDDAGGVGGTAATGGSSTGGSVTATGGVTSATGGVTSATGGASGGVTSATGGTGGVVSATGGSTAEPCTDSYEDRDGDGWYAFYETGDCGVVIGVTPSPWDDCDDTNAARQVTLYPDRDGDGSGYGVTDTLCAAEGDVPPGYSTTYDDCDDADPTRSPRLLDTPGDGIDQDCDLQDAVLCTPDQACPCSEMTTPVPPIDKSCDSFDLALLDSASCRLGCGSNQFIRIANLGMKDYTGQIRLTQGDLGETFSGTILAGSVTAPRRLTAVSAGYIITMIIDEPGDCTPGNDVLGTTAPPLPEPICK